MKSGDVCSGAGEAAQETDFGTVDSHDLFDIRHSSTIVLWGKNSAETNIHQTAFVERALDRGGRLIVVVPRRTLSAESAERAAYGPEHVRTLSIIAQQTATVLRAGRCSPTASA